MLEDVGLPVAAAVVMEVAASAPSGRDLCPFSPDDAANFKDWHDRYERRAWRAEQERRGIEPKPVSEESFISPTIRHSATPTASGHKKRPQPGGKLRPLWTGVCGLRDQHRSDVGSPPDDPTKLCVKVAYFGLKGATPAREPKAPRPP
jgi:hypothetical protein